MLWLLLRMDITKSGWIMVACMANKHKYTHILHKKKRTIGNR